MKTISKISLLLAMSMTIVVFNACRNDGPEQPTDIAVTSISLNKSTLSLTIGEERTLIATVLPENATDKTVTWRSDNEDVAIVDANGKVTAIKAGTATITAQAGEKTVTCEVSVLVYKIAEVPAVSNDKILETILAKHSGRPVFVNFWVTWCPFCNNANRTMAPLRAEMIERGVVMINITNESSPEATWLAALPDIGGIHYYLTNQQWTALRIRYQIQGFPTFMIFDRSGERTFKIAGFPGNDRMREELARVW